MVTGALPLLPVSTTKVGPGEKERAYIVRQNVVLKTLLVAFGVVSGLGMLLCCTVYEVHVQRRSSLEHKREHREEEHNTHMRVMRLSTLLQQRLKDEVHDMGVLTTYRAWLLRAVGEYQAEISLKLENCTEGRAHVIEAGASFDKRVDELLKRLWDDLVSEGRNAQTQLHNITTAIMSELRQESSEAAEFEQEMKEMGEAVRGEDEDEPDGAADEDSSLGIALEAFRERLLDPQSVLTLSNETIDEWQKQYDASMRVLGDGEKEADMQRIESRITELIAKAQAPAFNATDHPDDAGYSLLDYFSELLYKAKLAPFRDELLELLNRWKDEDAPLATPLRRVEELIDANVLQPDVLDVPAGDYRYRYEEEYGD